jgi:hypothetical protein
MKIGDPRFAAECSGILSKQVVGREWIVFRMARLNQGARAADRYSLTSDHNYAPPTRNRSASRGIVVIRLTDFPSRHSVPAIFMRLHPATPLR